MAKHAKPVCTHLSKEVTDLAKLVKGKLGRGYLMSLAGKSHFITMRRMPITLAVVVVIMVMRTAW